MRGVIFLTVLVMVAPQVLATTPVDPLHLRQTGALADATEWLQDQPPSVPAFEALHVAGIFVQPPPTQSEYSLQDIRLLHAIAAAGLDPAEPGLVGGDATLREILHSLIGPALAEGKIANLAWLALALHAAGSDGRLAEISAVILANQGTVGNFACNYDDYSADCAGFAAAALSAAGSVEHCPELLDYWHANNQNGSFVPGDAYTPHANANTQAWGLISFSSCGEPAPAGAWPWLLDLQNSDGSFSHSPQDASGGQIYPTADAVLALAGFPGPSWAPGQVQHELLPSGLHRVQVFGNFTAAAWTVDGAHYEGLALDLKLPPESHQLGVYATGNGTHFRAELTIWVEPDVGIPFTPLWLILVGLLGATLTRVSRGR